jgi:predicted GH43/DUF377 family glycosyl hydrolase
MRLIRPGKRHDWLIWVLPGAVLATLLVAIGYIAVDYYRQEILRPFRPTQTLSNVKQLANAAALYAAANDERLMVSDYRVALRPYIKDPKAMLHPHTGRPFRFNQLLLGAETTTMEETQRTVLFYHGVGRSFEYVNGLTTMSYVDTSALQLRAPNTNTVLWKPVYPSP